MSFDHVGSLAEQGEALLHLHYGDWFSAISWIVVFGIFVTFLGFQRKSRNRPTSVYVAFIVASALEMFGIPLSMYFVAWALGVSLPEGIFWGHTLQQYMGYWAMYIGYGLNLLGGVLIILGWKGIHSQYWRRDEGEGKLVTEGIYSYSRHPQYLGFILMTLGLLIHWTTIPLLIMWPMLVVQYYRLARREERDMEREFGESYSEYKKRVPMFIPFFRSASSA